MIKYDTAWHDRMAAMAAIASADPSIETRLNRYISLIMSDPKSLGAPYANARGILVNVYGLLEDEAYHHIQNEITLTHQKSTK
jgi:hypothetical protein